MVQQELRSEDVKLSPMLYERNKTLDTIRGFSLLGILLVNIIGFYTPLPHVFLEFWFTNAKDIIWHQYLDMYVQSSFYPLFSLLFGYGIAMQFMKADSMGRSFYKFAPKRLVAIFVIGLLHGFLLWWGDILMTYAVCGILLILFIRLKPIVLLLVAFLLNGIFHILYGGGMVLAGAFNLEIEQPALDIMLLDQVITAYGTGSWLDAFSQRVTDLGVQYNFVMWMVALLTILPYMLVGAALSKWRVVENAKRLKWMWILLAVVFVAAGLLLKALPIQFANTFGFSYLKVYVGGPMLALGYMAVIVVLCLVPAMQLVLSPFAKAGKMSLTLYITQSLICGILFYNYGFGLYGQVDVQMGVFIAFAIFAFQLVVAELWLVRFKQGPLEWIVKKFVYVK